MATLQRINSYKIYGYSEFGTFDEYDILSHAKKSKPFVVVKQERGYASEAAKEESFGYRLVDTVSEREIQINGWTFRINSIFDSGRQYYHKIGYSIIDVNGVIRHFTTQATDLKGFGECMSAFASFKRHTDWHQVDVNVKDHQNKVERESLQKQIDELKHEIKQLKEAIEK